MNAVHNQFREKFRASQNVVQNHGERNTHFLYIRKHNTFQKYPYIRQFNPAEGEVPIIKQKQFRLEHTESTHIRSSDPYVKKFSPEH